MADNNLNNAIEWVAQIAAGNAQAESELVEHYMRPIRLLLVKRTGDWQLSCDIAQNTFVVALSALRNGKLRKPEALTGFLRQTAKNLHIEHLRKEQRYVHQDDGIISLQRPHRDNKAEHMDRAHVRKLLDAVLQQLSQPRDREILQRFYLLEEDKPEICSALELSAAHFDRVLYRAKQRMREQLKTRPELKAMLFGGLSDA